MKKALLFIIPLILSTLVLINDHGSFIALGLIGIAFLTLFYLVLFAFMNLNKKVKDFGSLIIVLGLVSSFFLANVINRAQRHNRKSNVENSITLIYKYKEENNEFPSQLAAESVPSIYIGFRKASFSYQKEADHFFIEYQDGPNTVKRYNSKTKLWTRFTEWGCS